ncbi:hypothetical protein ACSNOI_01985 [Actinomadura kijaniata]
MNSHSRPVVRVSPAVTRAGGVSPRASIRAATASRNAARASSVVAR